MTFPKGKVHLGAMGKGFKRLAAALVLLAAVVNGLLGPMAHGHAMPIPAAQELEVAAVAAVDEAVHADCAGHEEDQAPTHPGGHSHGKMHGKAALVCSGATACCAALATIELPSVVSHDRVQHIVSPRLFFAGLTPPVGERPPSHV